MLSYFIGLLTVVLVLDCLFLLLLILIQLPKKEAGLGQAFGSGTTDALFGAGSGTALTKMTKYATGIFFVLAIGLAIVGNHQARARHGGRLKEAMDAAKATPEQTTPAPAPAAAGATSAPTPLKLNLPEQPLKAASNAVPPRAATSSVPATAAPVPAPATNKPAAPQPK